MRGRRKQKPPGLMLTSLLDMFTIILIFLIVSFEAEDQEFKLNPNLQLPESSASSVLKPAANLSVTQEGVFLGDGRMLVPLAQGRADPLAYEQKVIADLKDALEQQYDLVAAKYAGKEDEVDDPHIVVIQADRALDYETLYLVMRSAAQAGFYKYRLVVMKK